MKFMVLFLFISFQAWPKPVVLVGHYDAFNGAAFNNSERVAKALLKRFSLPDSPIDLKLCPLQTIFEKAFGQFEDCIKNLNVTPALVIGLGESTCQLKVEMVVRNKDRTYRPDNAGEERSNTIIIPEAGPFLGLHYPLPQMYCALSRKQRNDIKISNNAGSFVCNNTAFQMSYYYPELSFGFIHVPRQGCRNLARRTKRSVEMLSKMILNGVTQVTTGRLPTTEKELRSLRRKYEDTNECLYDFFNRARGVDE